MPTRISTLSAAPLALLSIILSAPNLAASPAAGDSAAPVPEVVVRAQREAIKQEAREFVRRVTGSSWANGHDLTLELWRQPVCLAVAGLSLPQGEFIYKRVTDVMGTAGVRIAPDHCHPNLIVVVTSQPDELLTAWRKRDRRLFWRAPPALVKQFFDPAPIRVWYNTMLTGEDSEPANASSALSSAGSNAQVQQMLADLPTLQPWDHPGGTRLSLFATHEFVSAIVIVDFRQCAGLDWGQLSDYIAMTALTNIDLHTNFADLPSVLALFSAPAEARPGGLTDWDRAFLKALYHTDRMSPLQRVRIGNEMVHDMDPFKATP